MYVDSESLARYAALRMRAPAHATSTHQGDRRSPFLGRGLEFADYRAYDPADDVRLVDWNVYLRLGTALVRQFHEERSLSVRIAVDVSGSMAFGTPRKADHAAQLAAALAVVSLAHRDPVTLTCFGGQAAPVQARAVNLDGLPELLHLLRRVEPGGRADAYAQLAASLGTARVDRLVLASDLLVEDDVRESLLRLLAASSRHPILLHVLGPDELEPDFADVQRVVDAETGEALVLGDESSLARRYQEVLDAWIDAIRTRCRTLGIHYVQTSTRDAVPDLVHEGLRRAEVVEHASGGNQ